MVEDDEFTRQTVKHSLEEDGYTIFEAANAVMLSKILEEQKVDTILLDHILPDGKGLELIPHIRQYTDAPIIIVSSKSDVIDKVLGLELGADDYVSKPIEMRELSARVKANIRRYKASNPSIEVTPVCVKFGKWTMDCSRYQIFDETAHPGDLTVKEFQILEALIRSAGRVLSREYLFTTVRDGNSDVTDRAVDVQITRIRKKIGDCAKAPQIIKTVRGIGYMFEGKTEIISQPNKSKRVNL